MCSTTGETSPSAAVSLNNVAGAFGLGLHMCTLSLLLQHYNSLSPALLTLEKVRSTVITALREKRKAHEEPCGQQSIALGSGLHVYNKQSQKAHPDLVWFGAGVINKARLQLERSSGAEGR